MVSAILSVEKLEKLIVPLIKEKKPRNEVVTHISDLDKLQQQYNKYAMKR